MYLNEHQIQAVIDIVAPAVFADGLHAPADGADPSEWYALVGAYPMKDGAAAPTLARIAASGAASHVHQMLIGDDARWNANEALREAGCVYEALAEAAAEKSRHREADEWRAKQAAATAARF